MTHKTILLIGTYDTKEAEMRLIEQTILEQGAAVLTLDVSVLQDPQQPTDISKHEVAAAAGSTIDDIIALNSEAAAYEVMARGAALLTARAHAAGRIDAMLATGGTLGTDLALDCAMALPLGVPKYIVSTVSFSAMIQPDRIAADAQMILWAGGLYGSNSICDATLRQAAGAVVGAARAAARPHSPRPMVGMTSLGSSCLRYMKFLKPALEARGFELAVFHSQGMGGMAFERLAAEGRFCCVMDFCMQELVNLLSGSLVSSGPGRLTHAGAAGVPQMVAPGALDLVDFAGWQEIPAQFADRRLHVHNRLIRSATLNVQEQARMLQDMAARLEVAQGPVVVFLPLHGVEEWDRAGQHNHDPQAVAAVMAAARSAFQDRVAVQEVAAHINDPSFAETVLAQFDDWVARGLWRVIRLQPAMFDHAQVTTPHRAAALRAHQSNPRR